MFAILQNTSNVKMSVKYALKSILNLAQHNSVKKKQRKNTFKLRFRKNLTRSADPEEKYVLECES